MSLLNNRIMFVLLCIPADYVKTEVITKKPLYCVLVIVMISSVTSHAASASVLADISH